MGLLSGSSLRPLRQPVFRRIWLASLLSNFGLLIQGVGAAWAMTLLDPRPQMVALVQTATLAPSMLFALASGALSDMFDRRHIALIGLSIALISASLLTWLAFAQMLGPGLLLAFCFLVGSGMALFAPAWQASTGEQVPSEELPAAIALNGISYNLARSFGPAMGGVIVALGGSVAAFLVNALFYFPILVVLTLWQRGREVSRLPPERLVEAMTSGLRYVGYSPKMRTLMWRSIIIGFAGSAIHALLPLVVRENLGGDARTYGIMLGCFGIGAVAGAIVLARVRQRTTAEGAALASAVLIGGALVIVATSPFAFLTGAALFCAGIGWTLILTLNNIGVQLSAPRWVLARAVATYQSVVAGGIAIGSWFWGSIAEATGIDAALMCAAGLMLASPILRRWLSMPEVSADEAEMGEERDHPEVALALTSRSGPIIVEVEYRIDPEQARTFYALMQDLKLSRRRNGAQIWSIARDVQDPWLWIERFHCATWLDYLRHRDRPTQAELELQKRAFDLHQGPEPVLIRRMLERPFGSVRWKEEAPDRDALPVLPGVPGGG